jgi:STE24 endopeptidase
MHPLIDPEKQKIARRYKNDHMKVGIASYVVSGILLIALLYFKLSPWFGGVLESFTGSRFLVALIYFAAVFIVYTKINFSFSYLSGFRIEHKYNFSTQNFRAWLADEIKSFLVGIILGLIVFEILYAVTLYAPSMWWLWLSLIMIGISVILANLFPVLILPLFYKTAPLDNEALINRIADACRRAGINLQGVYSINLSSKSTKANAMVVGLGNTKKILLGDTLLTDYTEDEIISVLCHEITHYRERHIWRLIFWQSLVTLGSFFVFSRIAPPVFRALGFAAVSEIGAFPLFAIIFGGLSLVTTPLTAAISRHYERRADRGALEFTGDPGSFISLIAKFCNRDLAIVCPNKLVEWYKYTHPSPGKRIHFAEIWKK